MKFTFAATLLLLVIGSGYSQTAIEKPATCSLKLAQSPSVRGMKLGMKLDDLLALFPGSREEEHVKNNITSTELFPRFGVVNVALEPKRYSTKGRFAGIHAVYSTFIDEQLVGLYVEYGQPPWPKLDDFVDKIADAFQLPPAAKWLSEGPSRKYLDCDGFRIVASTRDEGGALHLKTGPDPSQIQRERRAAAHAQARREFRP